MKNKKRLLFIILLLSVIFIILKNNKALANYKETTLEEGTYEIYSCLNDTKVINIQDGSKQDGANVNLYDRENRENQKFKVVLNEDGTYTFIALHSNKVLDVTSAGKANGTNVAQYEANGTNAQKWNLKLNRDGSYSILSKCNDLYLDVTCGNTQNGTNIQMYQENGTKAQKFEFSKVEDITGEKTLEEGIYHIYSQVASNRLLEVTDSQTIDGALLRTAANSNKASQKFKVSYHTEDGTYSIMLLHSKKQMDVQSAGGKNGTLVQQYSKNDTDAQKWVLVKNEDGTYSVIAKCNGLALDVAGGSTVNGANIQTYKYNGTQAQKFRFEACQAEKATKSAENGTYRILTMVDTRKAFDIPGGLIENGVKVQIWDNDKVIQQKFDIELIEDGYYKIKAKNSNKVLTVESQTPQVGSKITQEEDQNLITQKWILKKQSESVYSIVSKCGNLYIEVQSSNLQNGQALELKEQTDLTNQQFILINETPKENIEQIPEGVYQLSLKSGKTLDITGGYYDNFANAQIWSNDRVQQQKFHIYKIENTNYYKMVAVHSAKALDVQGGNSNIQTNVSQYDQNGTDSQYWLLRKCVDGYYNIISSANGLVLDVEGGKIYDNGTNIQLYYSNGTDSQKFRLQPINIIDYNTYEIETKLDSNKVVDIAGGSMQDGANAQIWDADNVNQQRFIAEALSTDTYKMLAKHSTKALTVNTQTGNVYQITYIGAEDQKWQIKEAGNNEYSLICKANGKALDVTAAYAVNGQNMQVYEENGTEAQKFKFVTGFRKFQEEGTYGSTGLAIARDGRGTNLSYYKYGKGAKHFFATFSIHGFEDSYNHDGSELTYIAEEFKKYLDQNIDEEMVNNWTIYIFPNLNPDGQTYGWSNNGPGRNTLFSAAPQSKGIDMNRNWSIGYKRETNGRYYNGTEPFQAYEARYLRDFLINHQGSQNFLVDTHGWLNETIGDEGLGIYYRHQFGLPTHINSYGSGYLINWARTLRNARSLLVELPQVSSHTEMISRNYAQNYIKATMQMLREN